jgi:hypothetical protein
MTSSSTATITGRVVGPDGLGRLGRLTLTPVSLGAPLPDRDVVAGRTSTRIDTDGYLVGPTGRSVTVSPGDYEIDLNIPGDSGVHLRRRVALSADQIFTLADLLSGTYTPPTPQPPPSPRPPADGILTPGSHEVRPSGIPGALEAANPVEVVDLGDGVLTWRRLDDGLVRPGGRGVQDADTPGILEAMDTATVIDLGNGTLTWR